MTDREYSEAGGSESAFGDGTVVWSRLRTEMVGERGLIGVAGRECCRYHANTVHASVQAEEYLRRSPRLEGTRALRLLTSVPKLGGVRRSTCHGKAWR